MTVKSLKIWLGRDWILQRASYLKSSWIRIIASWIKKIKFILKKHLQNI